MEYSYLGKTQLLISRIGFGGWGIAGGSSHHPWKDMWKANDKESKQSLKEAFENGVNFYDTALTYIDGHSERLINSTLPRKKIIIATKVPPLDGHWPAIDPNIQHTFPKEYIISQAKESYKNLGKKTIDILQLHGWLDDWFESNEWREAFSILKKQRIINFFGVSINEHAPASAMRIVDSGEIDTIQAIYNVFDQSPADNLFPLARKRGIGIIARVPLDEGSLAGTFDYDTQFDDWRKDYFTPERLKQTVDRIERIKKKLVNEHQSMTQVALRFCLEKPGADVAIVGMRNPKHVVENCLSVDIHFTPEELSYLKQQCWLRNFYPNIW